MTICAFKLQKAAVAKHIYGNHTHHVTSVGMRIDETMRRELSLFLKEFVTFIKCDHHLFMRLDVFVHDTMMQIIEINVELQDGWGVALNLLRASGQELMLRDGVRLPNEIILYREDYRPEFMLAQEELARLGHTLNIVGWRERPGKRAKSEYDDKLYLARFSRLWRGSLVEVPAMYFVEHTSWDDLPQDVVFKFSEKYGESARRAKYSVVRRSQIGKGKFIKQCYNRGLLIAQRYVKPPTLADGSSVQVIIMCSGSVPVTGYLQVAPRGAFVINDKNTLKGPLVFD